MPPATSDRSRALWQRQLVLTALAVLAFLVVAALSARVASVSDEATAARRLRLPEPDTTWLQVGLIVGTIVVLVLLVITCVHMLRIARLTFTRRETD